ncbi:hypothetical protein WDW86_21810 [Bdellovibrionota bacterium FG-2]
MKTILGLTLLALIVSQNAMATPPKKKPTATKSDSARFYDFAEQTINGEVHQPGISLLEGRTKVKFECEEFEEDLEQWRKCMETSFSGFSASKKKCCEGSPGEPLFCVDDRIKYKSVGNKIKSIEAGSAKVVSDFKDEWTPSC